MLHSLSGATRRDVIARETFPQLIRRLRGNDSQGAFSRRAGVFRMTISDWERGVPPGRIGLESIISHLPEHRDELLAAVFPVPVPDDAAD